MDGTVPALKARATFSRALRDGLVIQPVSFACSNCHGVTSSAMEWVCGYCHAENKRTALYSLLHKCERCDRSPKSYICPHCEKTSSLDTTGDNGNPAKKLTPRAKQKKPDERKKARREQRKEFHDETAEGLRQQIEIAELTARLNQAKGTVIGPDENLVSRKIEREITEAFDRLMSEYDAGKKLKAIAAERYKDDPDALRAAEEAIQRIIENRAL